MCLFFCIRYLLTRRYYKFPKYVGKGLEPSFLYQTDKRPRSESKYLLKDMTKRDIMAKEERVQANKQNIEGSSFCQADDELELLPR